MMDTVNTLPHGAEIYFLQPKTFIVEWYLLRQDTL